MQYFCVSDFGRINILAQCAVRVFETKVKISYRRPTQRICNRKKQKDNIIVTTTSHVKPKIRINHLSALVAAGRDDYTNQRRNIYFALLSF